MFLFVAIAYRSFHLQVVVAAVSPSSHHELQGGEQERTASVSQALPDKQQQLSR